MAISKKDLRALEQVLYHIDRAEQYLQKPSVVGIAHEEKHPNGGSYQIVNPACNPVHAVCVMNKFAGSNITGIYDAKKHLKSFLEAHAK